MAAMVSYVDQNYITLSFNGRPFLCHEKQPGTRIYNNARSLSPMQQAVLNRRTDRTMQNTGMSAASHLPNRQNAFPCTIMNAK